MEKSTSLQSGRKLQNMEQEKYFYWNFSVALDHTAEPIGTYQKRTPPPPLARTKFCTWHQITNARFTLLSGVGGGGRAALPRPSPDQKSLLI